MATQPVLSFDVELRLDTEHKIAVVPEVQIGRCQDGCRQIDHEARHRRQEQHTHELGQRVHVGAREDVAGFLQTGLLERLERLGRAERALEQHVAHLPGDGLGKQQQRAPGQIAEHVHQDGGDDFLRIPDQPGHILEPGDRHLGDRNHDAAMRQLRQRRRRVTRADVGDLFERVELQRFQITNIFHNSLPPPRFDA